MYQIEFLCHVGDKSEIRVLDTVRLVGGGDLARVVTQAEELFHKLDTLPRPDAFRIRKGDGEIVHERHELNERQNCGTR
jgi:hypothetical protein